MPWTRRTTGTVPCTSMWKWSVWHFLAKRWAEAHQSFENNQPAKMVEQIPRVFTAYHKQETMLCLIHQRHTCASNWYSGKATSVPETNGGVYLQLAQSWITTEEIFVAGEKMALSVRPTPSKASGRYCKSIKWKLPDKPKLSIKPKLQGWGLALPSKKKREQRKFYLPLPKEHSFENTPSQ